MPDEWRASASAAGDLPEWKALMVLYFITVFLVKT
jgi:hypothetical protein